LIQHFLKKGLEKNQAIISPGRTEDTRTLVSCGQINSEQKVRIVNLKTLMQCQPNEIGEVWVSGPSVASGYWNKTAENEFTFAAQLSGNNDGSSYLRSGDVGFLHEGELYITGRLKSLIISEGKNHYPHDIERTVESSHSAIRPAGCAVFSIRNAECEDIIIVAELEHKLFVMAEEIIKAIREAVSLNHGLHVHDIRLTKPGDIPKTTSGKIRYFLCKKNYVASILKGIETS
jgi:acyl-CoA synthetase (AMP-forming)/AMP-acid ligase II